MLTFSRLRGRDVRDILLCGSLDFATMCSLQFVCRRKVCSLIVRFYLLDVDIFILGLEMPKNYVSCRAFARLFVLLSSVISTFFWFKLQALYFAISAVP